MEKILQKKDLSKMSEFDLAKNRNFDQKLKFWLKIRIFVRKSQLLEKIVFVNKIMHAFNYVNIIFQG